MAVPTTEQLLPELTQFAQRIADKCQNGEITGWGAFVEQVNAFYTPATMDKIERILPGWGQMASRANRQTLIHVTSVLAALFLLPEYQQATAVEQTLMRWMVLFHDIAKEPQPGKHDYVHAFRSAAITGKAFSQVGFPITDAYPTLVDEWFTLTYNAIVYHEGHAENIQDNRKLPAILSGIDRLFGANAPAGLVIKAILFHLSIATDPSYPTVAPLTDAEIQDYIIDEALFPLLRAMMLVDTDGWNLFDSETKRYYRAQTLAVFDQFRTP